MITVTAFKWVPDFAKGQVRDHRVRWMLNELGWDYDVRLLDAEDQQSDAYRAMQPFGQVPALAEEGKPPLFETGAIVLELALRAGRFLPSNPDARGQVLAFYFAALNTVEPPLMNVAITELFTKDEELQAKQRPQVMEAARKRLAELEAAIGDRQFLVGEAFTIADLMVASILKGPDAFGLLKGFPKLAAWQARILERPAYRKAISDQCADFAGHGPADMKYPQPAAA